MSQIGRRSTFLVCLGLVLLVVLVYGQVAWHEFVSYDDPKYVYENPHVISGLTASNARWAFEIHGPSMWIPLTWVSHQAAWQVFGDKTAGHHLVNVLLHAANVLLLFGVLKRMTATVWPSALVAALFAIHPLHVESVAWVTERKDVLCGLFWMLTLWAYWCFTAQGGLWRYLLVVFSFTLAVMAKPLAVTLPCVLLLLDYWPLGRLKLKSKKTSASFLDVEICHHRQALTQHGGRRLFRCVFEKIPLLGIAALASYLTILCQREIGAISSLETLPLSTRLANGALSYVAYLRKFFWPNDLACFYPYSESPAPWQVLTAIVLLLLITMIVTWQGRRRPYLLVGWLWYIGVMVPMSGLVQGGSHSMADRFSYLPLVGVYLALAFGLHELGRKVPKLKWPLVYGSSVALLILLPVSWFQIGTWRDSLSLYNHALRVTTENYTIHNNLGNALKAKGRPDKAIAHYQSALRIKPDDAKAHYNLGNALEALGRPAAGLAHYQQALRINPKFFNARNNLGNALLALGRPKDALAHYQDALRMKPDYAEAHNNLGRALLALGRPQEALAQYQNAVRIKPDMAEAHYNLGHAQQALGRPKEAFAHYQDALRFKPDFALARNNLGNILQVLGRPEDSVAHYKDALRIRPKFAEAHYNLGNVLQAVGRLDEALAHYQDALRIKPAFAEAYFRCGTVYKELGEHESAVKNFDKAIKLKPDFAHAYNDLAWLLATCPDERYRDGEKAVSVARRLCELLGWDDSSVLNTLSAAYAENGQFAEAVKWQIRANELAPDGSKAELQSRLQLYEASKPYRETK